MEKHFVQVGDVYLTRFHKGKPYFGQSAWEASLYTLSGAKRQMARLLYFGYKDIRVVEYYSRTASTNS